MTVSELITYLQTFPNDIQVAYKMFSEQCLLKADEIYVNELCEPRQDGWIQNKRSDKPKIKYLIFPGN